MFYILANAAPWDQLVYAVVSFVIGWLLKSPVRYGRRKDDIRP